MKRTIDICGLIIFLILAQHAGAVAELIVDSNNNLFVADRNVSVIKISPDGARSAFVTFERKPLYLSADGKDGLFVADSGGTIFKVNPKGTKTTFATGLKKPTSLQCDGAGNLWVFDSELHALYAFAPDGKKKTVLRDVRTSIFPLVDNVGNVFVPDYDLKTIFKFTPDGTKTTFAPGVSDASALASDRAGNQFIYNNSDNSIVRIAGDGTQTKFATWNGNARTWLLCDNAGNLLVPSDEDRSIVRFAPDGTKGTFVKDINPVSVSFDHSGNLFVWDMDTLFKIAADGTKTRLFSDLVSPDKRWEYQCSEEGDNAGLAKVGSNDLVVNLSENIPAQWAHEVTVLWAPDSKRVALNYRAGGRYNSTVLYQLVGEKWKELQSPEDQMGKVLERVQQAQAIKEHLPKKAYRRRIWDSYRTRQWVDNNTAVLYGYSNRSVQFNNDLSTNEEMDKYHDLVAHVLFTLKFDPKGNWKIVKTHEMSAKEVDEED